MAAVSSPTPSPAPHAPAPRPPGAGAAPPSSGTDRNGLRAHLRATAVLLALTVLVGGVAYPLALTGFAQTFFPASANGSLLYAPNGTLLGSKLVAQNLTSASCTGNGSSLGCKLFWARPSLSDYVMTLGAPSPVGPADPALYNETVFYLAFYNQTAANNSSIPLSLVTPSGSGVDPDLTPAAVLVQIPRIHLDSGVNVSTLLDLVNRHVVRPGFGFVGPAYVDVLVLDLALLPLVGG